MFYQYFLAIAACTILLIAFATIDAEGHKGTVYNQYTYEQHLIGHAAEVGNTQTGDNVHNGHYHRIISSGRQDDFKYTDDGGVIVPEIARDRGKEHCWHIRHPAGEGDDSVYIDNSAECLEERKDRNGSDDKPGERVRYSPYTAYGKNPKAEGQRQTAGDVGMKGPPDETEKAKQTGFVPAPDAGQSTQDTTWEPNTQQPSAHTSDNSEQIAVEQQQQNQPVSQPQQATSQPQPAPNIAAAKPQAVDKSEPKKTDEEIAVKQKEFTDDLFISEIMIDMGSGRFEYAQWIEITNASNTLYANLKGWELEIKNGVNVSDVDNPVFVRKIRFKEMEVGPRQSILVATTHANQMDTSYLDRDSIVNIYRDHKRLSGMKTRVDKVISGESFFIKLKNEKLQTVDIVGNSNATWEIPHNEKSDDRKPIVRQLRRSGYPRNGKSAKGWILADDIGLTWYGDENDWGSPGYVPDYGNPEPVEQAPAAPVLIPMKKITTWGHLKQ